MTETRLAIGLEKLAEIEGHLGEQLKDQIGHISPDLAEMVIALFGDVYAREGLSLQERERIAISTLLAMGGCEDQVRLHTHAALKAGVTKGEIVEILIQDINYCGIARVLNAAKVVQEVFADWQN